LSVKISSLVFSTQSASDPPSGETTNLAFLAEGQNSYNFGG